MLVQLGRAGPLGRVAVRRIFIGLPTIGSPPDRITMRRTTVCSESSAAPTVETGLQGTPAPAILSSHCAAGAVRSVASSSPDSAS